MDCEAPQKFAPNMDKIKKAIGYDEASGKSFLSLYFLL